MKQRSCSGIYRKRRYKKKSFFSGSPELLFITLFIGLLVFLVSLSGNALRKKEQSFIIREANLEKQILQEKERTQALNSQKIYVKTDRYIEEVAREKLGLLNPDEILLKESE